MRLLPLYTAPRTSAVNTSPTLGHDPACTRCDRGDPLLLRSVCMKPEVQGNDGPVLLVVGEAPNRAEDAAQRPLGGAAGTWLRPLIAKLWPGIVVYESAVRCGTGAEVKDKHVEACRPYLARTVGLTRPVRILVLGKWAALGVLGRTVNPASVRRGYGWHIDEEEYEATGDEAAAAVPVYLLPSPRFAVGNRFHRADFEADLERALRSPVPEYRPAGAEQTVLVESESDALDMVEAYHAAGVAAYDTETSGRMFTKGFRIEALTIWPMQLKGPAAWEVATLGFTFSRGAIESPWGRRWLANVLENPDLGKVGANIKYDENAVWCEPLLHVSVQGVLGDTRLDRKLLEAAVDGSLAVGAELVGMGGHKDEAREHLAMVRKDLLALVNEPARKPLASGKPRPPAVLNYLKRAEVDPECILAIRTGAAEVDTYSYRYLKEEVRSRYNALDACSTAHLYAYLAPRVEAAPNITLVRDEITNPAARAVVRMEQSGFGVDRAAMVMFGEHLDARRKEAEAKLAQYGAEVNWGSVKQVAEVLYVRLGLPVLARTESGAPSTDAATLEKLADKHPLPRAMLELRAVTTMEKFGPGMIPHIRDDGRLHPSYLLDGTASGRPSAQAPNLLNIPRAKGSVEGKMVRDCFIARPGYKLVELDMSQQELRIAARRSGDRNMVALFQDDSADFHMAVLERVCEDAYGVPLAEVQRLQAAALRVKLAKRAGTPYDEGDRRDADRLDEMRSRNKGVVFGRMYGKTEAGFAADFGISTKAAARIVQAVTGQFPDFNAWCITQMAFGRRHGGVYTEWRGQQARWRPLPAIADAGDARKGARENAERSTINTPIQGEAADYVTASLWPIIQAYDAEGLDAQLICTVYDSVLSEVADADVADSVRLVRAILTSHDSGPVPLKADCKTGQSWGSMTDYELPRAQA